MDLRLLLAEAAARYHDKTLIVSGERKVTCAELDIESNAVANALLRMGLEKGDRVALLLSNSPDFVAIYFGIVKIGAIVVALDPKYRLPELTALFDDCTPKVLIGESAQLEALTPALPGFTSVKHVIDMDGGSRFPSFREMVRDASTKPVTVPLSPDDVAQIAYTSAPTFSPKGSVLLHGRIVTEVWISGEGYQQTEKDIGILFAAPMHHAVGMVLVMLTCMSRGSTVVMVPGLSIPTLTQTINSMGATMLLAVPFVYTIMIQMAKEEGVQHELKSLRLCGSGGAPLFPEVRTMFRKLYGHELVDFWGLTEATGHVTCQAIDNSGSQSSVGKPLPGWQVRIVDDDGHELPPGKDGEIIVHGPIMQGYYNKPETTAKAIRNGWLYSGDIGRLDRNGELYITGRKKDMIIVKGQNVYPSDIEHVLRLHPKIAEAVALGIHDKVRGEVVGAVISLKKGETLTDQEVRHFCLNNMANYKTPKEIIFLNQLPRTGAGGISKKDIREQLSLPAPFK